MSVGHLVLVLLTVYNASERVTQKDYPSLKETDQLDQRNTHQGLHFPFRQRRVHKHSVSARSESQCGAHAVTEDRTADSDAEDDDEVRNDSDSDQLQSAVSEPQSQDLCEVCLVQQRDTRLACCAVRAPAFLCFLRRSAWVTSSRLPSMPHWHQHGLASVLVGVKCCWCWQCVYTDYTYSVFAIAFWFFFQFILTLMIILTTCVCSLVLLQTATSVKILRNRSIKTAESRHTENTQVNSATVTHDSVEWWKNNVIFAF